MTVYEVHITQQRITTVTIEASDKHMAEIKALKEAPFLPDAAWYPADYIVEEVELSEDQDDDGE